MMAGIGPDQMDFDFQDMLERFHPKAKQSPRNDRCRRSKGPIRPGMRKSDRQGQNQFEGGRIGRKTPGSFLLTSWTRWSLVKKSRGADVSRQGVQRDLLPIVEGTTVQTKYGYVNTDHILFRRIRGVPSKQPERPDARTSRPVPDPRRALGPDPKRFRPDSDRADQRVDQTIHRALKTESIDLVFEKKLDRDDGRIRISGKPNDAKYRRPAALHDP